MDTEFRKESIFEVRFVKIKTELPDFKLHISREKVTT